MKVEMPRDRASARAALPGLWWATMQEPRQAGRPGQRARPGLGQTLRAQGKTF